MKIISGLVSLVSLVLMIMAEETDQVIIWGIIALYNQITMLWMILEDKIDTV